MKKELSFEEKLQEKVKSGILKQVEECRYIEHYYPKGRHVPEDIVEKAWAAIDWQDVISRVTEKIQDHICATITNAMITEAKTDVKKVLANYPGVREALRAKAYPKIMEVLEDKKIK